MGNQMQIYTWLDLAVKQDFGVGGRGKWRGEVITITDDSTIPDLEICPSDKEAQLILRTTRTAYDKQIAHDATERKIKCSKGKFMDFSQGRS